MEPGHKIENYVIIEKIGQGGQAAVWSAYDERLKRTVAIKTINLAPVASDGDSSTQSGISNPTGTAPASSFSALTNPDRFREEAQIIAALEHPNILPIYAFGQEEDTLYIVMRYMAAGSLKDLLKQEPLSPERVATLMEPLGGALDLAHQHQIIHRDIKAANILLDAQLHPYLADFGLSMTKGDRNSESGVGTLAYMSPEQMMGDPLDQRSDLYAFGILMYELLVGHLPSVDGQSWNIHQTMRNAPLPVPDTMEFDVQEVLRKATALSPDDRYQTATEATTALREAITEHLPQGYAAAEVLPEITDPAMLALIEAQDLFFKAQERWSDGAGRFRFEAGEFKYVDSYFIEPETWQLELSDIALRLMLRGALEHGYNTDYWWEQNKDIDDRRAVTLQTLTSEQPSARLRAMERLTYIQDSEPPAIPIRVATVIAQEADAGVRLAGIRLLEKRASKADGWRPLAYTELIDGMLAKLAGQDRDRGVAEAAARTVARVRSTFAVNQLAQQAAAHDRGAFNALINIRDEVPALPSEVPAAIRRDVFIALSRRQLFADPLQLVLRFLAASLGAGVMLGTFVYWQFSDPTGLRSSQRLNSALAIGALYGLMIGFGVLATTEPAHRLRAWTRWSRIALAIVLGTLLSAATFDVYHRIFDDYTPAWQWLVVECVIFVAGLSLPPRFSQRIHPRGLGGGGGRVFARHFAPQNTALH